MEDCAKTDVLFDLMTSLMCRLQESDPDAMLKIHLAIARSSQIVQSSSPQQVKTVDRSKWRVIAGSPTVLPLDVA